MLGLELLVAVGLAILVGTVTSGRLRVPEPLLLLTLGVIIGFVPALRRVQFSPDVVLLLFLPALVYWESVTTSLRQIRRDLRGIVLVSTLLVILTAAVVAVVAHELGLSWGATWVLGVSVAPSDATALGVVARLLPRRNVTQLRAESLINDGTALVVYGLTVGIAVGEEHFSVPHVLGLFLLSYVGGAAAGALTAWVGIQVRRRVDAPLAENTAILLIPFTAYPFAESIEASGVLAVIACGLIMSQAGPRLGHAHQRRQTEEFWSLATFLLNGTLFVLVGLEVRTAVRDLSASDLGRALAAIAAISVTLVVVRFVFLVTSIYTIRALDRSPSQKLRRSTHRARVVSALSGFRGAVSLAMVLSVPTALDSGEPFPDRDAIIFVTCGVIVVTLLQRLLLPGVVRWPASPTTPPSKRNATSRRPPPRKPSPSSRNSPRPSTPHPRPPIAFVRSTRPTWRSCRPTRASRRHCTRGTTPPCAWPCSPTNAAS
ncbi:Na+/H+ antiporter [Streptomyces mirabilis]|uniref:Na+/H+ antiporter n=1 Tax=Streptomyces mirabilis TaxID=68239 RepID=UPI00201D4B31|nr:Na+/H+ antiporter [Streptomyces mirabilis]